MIYDFGLLNGLAELPATRSLFVQAAGAQEISAIGNDRVRDPICPITRNALAGSYTAVSPCWILEESDVRDPDSAD